MNDEPVVVFRSQGPLEAEVALSKLTSEGVLAFLRYEAVGRTLGLTIDGLGRVEVLVAPVDVARASEILETLPGDEGIDEENPEWQEADGSEDEAEDES
ncbi:MAG: DUF2007 domain-containing protein [Anaerolineae bacterium]